MENMRVSLIFFIFVALACMPSLSYSDVKVTLNNGREIVADTCEEEGGQLVCTKMGGTFNIEKKDVGSIREIKSRGNEPSSVEPASPPPAEPGKKTDDTPGEDSPDKIKPSAGEQSGAMKRLEEITQKKKELSSERVKLVKEREQLDEDLKKAPDWMPTDQYEELNKRNDQFKEKMKLFNEEAGRLNEEEKRIVEGLKKKD
jgi:hypothetical protein